MVFWSPWRSFWLNYALTSLWWSNFGLFLCVALLVMYFIKKIKNCNFWEITWQIDSPSSVYGDAIPLIKGIQELGHCDISWQLVPFPDGSRKEPFEYP
jgi:hypothetical protein